MKKTIKEILLDRIVYIGNDVPESVAKDQCPKFILLGTPQDFMDEIERIKKK